MEQKLNIKDSVNNKSLEEDSIFKKEILELKSIITWQILAQKKEEMNLKVSQCKLPQLSNKEKKCLKKNEQSLRTLWANTSISTFM